jgi:ABC-type nickel/cobalt efflux system permease component RcnA
VALVYAGVGLLNLGRAQLVGVTERVMAPASYAAIALVGLWLVWRGLRRLRSARRAGDGHGHDHGHDHAADGTCGTCGHKHGPDLEEVERVGSLREAAVLVASIAARPCTGALFVLILTWQMGIGGAGIAGAFAMALGTAVVTLSVGLGALGLRGGLAGAARGWHVAGVALPMIELSAGLIVATIAGGLLLRAI